MYILTQGQRDQPLLMSVEYLLMDSYSPLIDFKPSTSVRHNRGTGFIAIGTGKIHLAALLIGIHTDTHTDKNDSKSSTFILRTVTNSFILRARN
uniref:Uncharacterized protein n=1 Tax=Hyaloperonospora arabidopsidis (strain Emoy2) TaxID=559515 RepID=M4B4L7_HYAAE